VTNLGAGLSGRSLSHEEVLETAGRARVRMEGLLREIVARLGSRGPS
jgi:purine nucleoside phosphorylase